MERVNQILTLCLIFILFLMCFSKVHAVEGLEFQADNGTWQSPTGRLVTGLAGGGFVVIWTTDGQDGSKQGIFGQQYKANGEKLGDEFQVNDTTHLDQFFPEAVGLADGGYMIVWASQGTSRNGITVKPGIYAKRYQANGVAIGDEFGINTDSGYGGGAYPKIAELQDGSFIIAWSGYAPAYGDTYGVLARKFNSDGTPNGVEFLANTYTLHTQGIYGIAVSNNGNFMIVWTSINQDDSGEGVYGQVFLPDGTKVGSEIHISVDTNLSQSHPDIAPTLDGGFVVVYHTNKAFRQTYVVARKINSVGQAEGTEKRLSTLLDVVESRPSITSNNDGSFFVTWSAIQFPLSLDPQEIWGLRLDAQLGNIGDVFKVDTSPNVSANSDVTSLSDDGALVVWLDVSTISLKGQRYNKFGEAIELVVPQLNLGFTKTLSNIHDANGDGVADKAEIFVPQLYDYRLSLDELDSTVVNDQLKVTDQMNGWSIVSAVASVGATTSSIVDGNAQLVWDLLGVDISTVGNAYVDIQLKESCGPKYIGKAAFLQRQPVDIAHFITVDVPFPQVCLVRLYDANGDGVVKYDGTGDEDGNGITDFIEACEMQQDPCME